MQSPTLPTQIQAALDADAKLLRLLRDAQVPPLRADFADSAIRIATLRGEALRLRKRRTVRWVGAIAASVATVAVVLGVLVATSPQADRSGGSPLQVMMQPLQNQIVRVLIESSIDREDATITISLADNLELEGFPDDRVVEWNTPLKQGKNLLALPLRLTNDADSHLEVAFSHGQAGRKVRIAVSAVAPQPLA